MSIFAEDWDCCYVGPWAVKHEHTAIQTEQEYKLGAHNAFSDLRLDVDPFQKLKLVLFILIVPKL